MLWDIDIENKYDFWVLRWIAMPLMTILAVGAVWWLSSNDRKCQNLAEENGYTSGTYNPHRMPGLIKDCTYTGRVLPDGSIDEEQSIDIDFRR